LGDEQLERSVSYILNGGVDSVVKSLEYTNRLFGL
jgi:hypothetical protein